jgi:hypothetical protein
MKKLVTTLLLMWGFTSLFGQTHFVPAFEGNGQDHMNIYVLEAEVGGVPLEAGDEVAAFDGSICCGVFVLTQPFDYTQGIWGVIRASYTDPGEANGYTQGHAITLKFWDSSALKEYSTVALTYYNTSIEEVPATPYTIGGSVFIMASAADILPDIVVTMSVTPNSMDGETNFELVVRITELNGADSNGEIRIVIPRDIRWSFTWNGALTQAGGMAVNNSVWSYDGSNDAMHIFTTTAVIAGNSSLVFGLQGVFDPGSTRGVSTVTSQIVAGSGGDSRVTNNSDSEVINYFGG